MRYADTLLANGEIVVVRSRQHWLALIAKARWALLAWLVALVAVGISLYFGLDGTAADVVGGLALIALVVGIVLFFLHAWRWWAQDYIVTNRRIMKVEGVFNKHAADSSLEKINDAVLRQGIVARMLGYGDLDILTAADSAIDRYRMLASAAQLQDRDAQPQARPRPRDRRLDAGATRAHRPPGPPPTPQPAPAPATSAPPAEEADDPETITRTLAQLSDLRDRGAITAEEYEAKKAELLGRL